MSANLISKRALLQIALLSILLAVQSLSFAHEVTHHSGGETELCEMCSLSGTSPVIVSEGQHEVPEMPSTCRVTHRGTQISSIDERSAFDPRAPPNIL